MIVDLFSHKIHSSGDNWPDKLAELAAIFGEFDGQLFDRKKFEERLQTISPRVAYFAKDAASRRGAGGRLDVSKFRDEISAYPAYLGLYFLEQSSAGWVVRVSETAKKFLLREEPDIGSFLRLQLPLLQFPNAMGAAYYSFTNRLRIQNNARDHTLELVEQHTHLSPLRLIIESLKADASLRGVSVENAAVSYGEIYGLANISNINRRAHPSPVQVVRALDGIRLGRLTIPKKFERRFHLLRHTEMFTLGHGSLTLRQSVNEADRKQLLRQIEAISSIRFQFDGFDHCTDGSQIEDVIASGEWGRYFDGVQVLPANIVEALTNDKALDSVSTSSPDMTGEIIEQQPQLATELYPFRERTDELPEIRPFNRGHELADPEATRIKKQRRNLKHKELIDKMDAWLRRLGARPTENEHIDLFARIPHDGSFIFEMKSGGESILDQIRKGLSQLYEYRFRYRPTLGGSDISLCLVLPESPGLIPWIIEYLAADREINVCWFDEKGNLSWPDLCAANLEVLSLHQGVASQPN